MRSPCIRHEASSSVIHERYRPGDMTYTIETEITPAGMANAVYRTRPATWTITPNRKFRGRGLSDPLVND